MATAPKTEAVSEVTAVMHIDKIPAETLLVPLVGTAPLIVHRFSEKAKRQMLDAQQGRKKVKENRDPEADYLASLYVTDDGGYGFPVMGFKAATVSAARFYDKSVTMVSLRQCLFMHGEQSKQAGCALVRIEGTPLLREDMVRVGMGTDLRYRGEFAEWTATLRVVYVKSMLSRASVISLIDAGGMGVGVGEWRPEKRGDFGTYAVDQTREIEVVDSSN